MTKTKIYILFILPLFIAAPSLFADDLSGVAQAKTDLYDGFKNPPNAARPSVRWWWPDNPAEQEINRQLDMLKNAGFGGVEISPAKDVNAKMFKFAADAAKQRQMLVDLSIGSEFSAPNLKPGEQIQIITLGKKMLKGPVAFKAKIDDLVKLADVTQHIAPDPNRRLLFLRLVPLDGKDFTQGDEKLDKIQPDGKVAFDIPDGNYVLYTGVWHENFIKPAGAVGPVIDPFNKQAVEKYLKNISDKLGPALDGKLGNSIHAVSCDGIEMFGANWTNDFARQFLQRRGYDITPYLPFILDVNFPRERAYFYDTVRRTRYDFCTTFVELFDERFTQTFLKWCRDNGVLSRLQAAGNPFFLDIFNSYMLPDIPVGVALVVSEESVIDPNTALEMRYRVVNKIASSAAHLAAKPIVSCRSIAPSAGVFPETLEGILESDDLSFISGINQTVLNGYDYSPANASFPPAVHPGVFLSDKNPWWPFCKQWSDRNARLSALFQNSRHQARIAILSPTADLYSDCGLSGSRFVDYIWYLFPLWQALNHNGYTTDYISEKILSQMTYDDGKLHYGALVYDVVIVPDAFLVDFPLAGTLRFYAQAGGKIIIIGRPPLGAPGFKDIVERCIPVQFTMDYVLKTDPNRVARLPAPQMGKDDLIVLTSDLMNKISVKPTVKILPVNPNLFFVHYLADSRDIFFFINTNRASAVSFRAQFDTNDKTPWLWDPETGNRNIFPYGENKNLLDISLQPLESILLVFEPNMPSASPEPKPAVDFNDGFEIKTLWQAEFIHCATGEKFTKKFDKLIDLGQSRDSSLNTFAGVVIYRTEFDASDPSRIILDLGKVADISEVNLNGKPLGLRWFGRHIYNAADAIKPGKNTLEIKVATSLVNYTRSLKDKRFAPSPKPAPAGLIGPVRLLKTREH